jgi:DNA-binding Xre family transcriptional regulator
MKVKKIVIEEEVKEERIPLTKLDAILMERELSQGDLRRMIKRKSGFVIGRDRISKICTGKTKTYNLLTGVLIAEALDIKIDEIIELKNVRKTNK